MQGLDHVLRSYTYQGRIQDLWLGGGGGGRE